MRGGVKYPIHFVKAVIAGYKLRREEMMIKQWKYTAQRLPVIDKKYDIAISFRHFDIDIFFTQKNIKADRKYFWVHGIQKMTPEEVKIIGSYYKKYNGIFPVSISASNNIQQLFPDLKEKCKVAYCVVDSAEIVKKSKYGKDFPNKIIEKDTIILFTIGRLGTEKGIDIAIEAAKLLKERKIKFKWYVAGEGNQRKSLEKMIEEYNLKNEFFLLGNVNNPYRMLKECQIYVQPSRLESYGLAVNEAKIFRKVIICSDIPAGREQIISGKTGILVELSGEKFANAIEKLIRDKEMRENLENGLKKDWSHFEAVEIFKKIVDDKI